MPNCSNDGYYRQKEIIPTNNGDPPEIQVLEHDWKCRFGLCGRWGIPHKFKAGEQPQLICQKTGPALGCGVRLLL